MYCFNGKLSNIWILRVKSKQQTDVIDKLLYADDVAEDYKTD